MLTQDEIERERYEARMKAQRDAATFERFYKLQAEQKRAEGLEHGELIGSIHFSQRLLNLTPTPREELLALPIDQLRQMMEQLPTKLATRE